MCSNGSVAVIANGHGRTSPLNGIVACHCGQCQRLTVPSRSVTWTGCWYRSRLFQALGFIVNGSQVYRIYHPLRLYRLARPPKLVTAGSVSDFIIYSWFRFRDWSLLSGRVSAALAGMISVLVSGTISCTWGYFGIVE